MLQGWRVTTINGLLLACYFVPAWTLAAFKIVVFPIRGIYDRANIGTAIYVADAFQLSALGTVRFAWLLALAKFVVVAYFLLFAAQTFRLEGARRGKGDEALAFALSIGIVISVASMLAASHVGEIASLRLHATEALMLIGGFVLLAIDSQSYGVKRRVPAVTAQAVA